MNEFYDWGIKGYNIENFNASIKIHAEKLHNGWLIDMIIYIYMITAFYFIFAVLIYYNLVSYAYQ
jgi:hypothetical protein